MVHSFTGTAEELQQILRTGLYLGLNGCSLKTAENLSVLRSIPYPHHRILLETDAPYCGIHRSSPAHSFVHTRFEECRKEQYAEGMVVKTRTEPAHVVQVLEAIAGIWGVDEAVVADESYQSTRKLFGLL